MRPISSHLDRTNLVNKGFIIWLLVKFCLRDTAGSPRRALHLARSGSQSQCAIWFILPARGASHIINRLGQIPRKPAFLKFCRQTRGKVGKHIFLVKNYSLNMKKLFTRPDFEFLTVKLQL